MDSIEVTKTDGNKMKINFQYENGLSLKPIIFPNYEIKLSETNKIGIFIYLKNDELKSIKEFNILDYAFIENNLIFNLENKYIVLIEPDDIIKENIPSNNYYLGFYDEYKKFIIGFE